MASWVAEVMDRLRPRKIVLEGLAGFLAIMDETPRLIRQT